MPRLTAARCADTVLAAAVAAPALAVTVWSVLAGQSPPWPVVAMLGVAAAAMFARRTRPVPAALVTSVAYVIAVQSGGFDLHGSSPGTIAGTIGTGIAVPAQCYTLGSSVRLPGSLAGLAVLSASLQWRELNPFPVMLTVGLWLVGRAVRSHRLLAASLRIRAFELESEREQFAAETVRYERDRIARELHDVIGHSVSDISGLTRLLNPALEHPLTKEHLEDLLARTAQTGVQLDFEIVGDVSPNIPAGQAMITMCPPTLPG